jgi:hypothetical protein
MGPAADVIEPEEGDRPDVPLFEGGGGGAAAARTGGRGRRGTERALASCCFTLYMRARREGQRHQQISNGGEIPIAGRRAHMAAPSCGIPVPARGLLECP